MAYSQTNISSYNYASLQDSINGTSDNFILLDNISDYYKFEGELIFGFDILNKYSNILKTGLITYTVSPDNFYRPEYVSKEIYGTTDLWYLLLFVNDMATVREFNKSTIYVHSDTIIDVLYNIISNEREILYSITSPKAVSSHTLKNLNDPSIKLFNSDYTKKIAIYKEISIISKLSKIINSYFLMEKIKLDNNTILTNTGEYTDKFRAFSDSGIISIPSNYYEKEKLKKSFYSSVYLEKDKTYSIDLLSHGNLKATFNYNNLDIIEIDREFFTGNPKLYFDFRETNLTKLEDYVKLGLIKYNNKIGKYGLTFSGYPGYYVYDTIDDDYGSQIFFLQLEHDEVDKFNTTKREKDYLLNNETDKSLLFIEEDGTNAQKITTNKMNLNLVSNLSNAINQMFFTEKDSDTTSITPITQLNKEEFANFYDVILNPDKDEVDKNGTWIPKTGNYRIFSLLLEEADIERLNIVRFRREDVGDNFNDNFFQEIDPGLSEEIAGYESYEKQYQYYDYLFVTLEYKLHYDINLIDSKGFTVKVTFKDGNSITYSNESYSNFYSNNDIGSLTLPIHLPYDQKENILNLEIYNDIDIRSASLIDFELYSIEIAGYIEETFKKRFTPTKTGLYDLTLDYEYSKSNSNDRSGVLLYPSLYYDRDELKLIRYDLDTNFERNISFVNSLEFGESNKASYYLNEKAANVDDIKNPKYFSLSDNYAINFKMHLGESNKTGSIGFLFETKLDSNDNLVGYLIVLSNFSGKINDVDILSDSDYHIMKSGLYKLDPYKLNENTKTYQFIKDIETLYLNAVLIKEINNTALNDRHLKIVKKINGISLYTRENDNTIWDYSSPILNITDNSNYYINNGIGFINLFNDDKSSIYLDDYFEYS